MRRRWWRRRWLRKRGQVELIIHLLVSRQLLDDSENSELPKLVGDMAYRRAYEAVERRMRRASS